MEREKEEEDEEEREEEEEKEESVRTREIWMRVREWVVWNTYFWL